MTAPSSPIQKSIEFLGKVKFTIILLIVGAIVMTVGTIVESRVSRAAAQGLIYGAHWFDLFLFLIGLNLTIAVVNRIPIKRHQWPFVLTHAAIVFLLIGSWVSHTFGYEGRMFIYEGSESNRIFMENKQLTVSWSQMKDGQPSGTAATALPLTGYIGRSGRTLQKEETTQPGVRVVQHLQRGVASIQLGEGNAAAPPGVQFTLSGQQEYSNDFLVAGDARFERKDLGAVEVEFLQIPSQKQWDERIPSDSSKGFHLFIHLQQGDEPIAIPLPAKVGEEISLGHNLTAKVEHFFLHTKLSGNQLIESPKDPLNPAAIVLIRSGEQTERHVLFSNYPNFDAMHGRERENPLVQEIQLEGSRSIEKPLLSILVNPEGQTFLQVTTLDTREQAFPIAVAQGTSLESLGLQFQLSKYVEHARLEQRVRPAPEGWEGPGGDFVDVELSWGGEQKRFWLAYGDSDTRYINGTPVRVDYGDETRTVPFTIALQDFQISFHPGSMQPSQYQSVVTVKPTDSTAAQREVIISMNRPLDEQGFRLFQSSYQLGQGQRPDATILTVNYDPGVKIVYGSFALVVLGIAWYVWNQSQRIHAVGEAANGVAIRSKASFESPASILDA